MQTIKTLSIVSLLLLQRARPRQLSDQCRSRFRSRLGNGAAIERVELHAETVGSATAVTDQAERDVLSCRAALHSLQRKIKAHNELQR